MTDIAERMLELAKEALAEQERQVADIRTRAATVLAAVMNMAEPKLSATPQTKPEDLPAPDQLRPMPSHVMNWEKKSLDDPVERADSRSAAEPHS